MLKHKQSLIFSLKFQAQTIQRGFLCAGLALDWIGMPIVELLRNNHTHYRLKGHGKTQMEGNTFRKLEQYTVLAGPQRGTCKFHL